jgi:hypothetical protein
MIAIGISLNPLSKLVDDAGILDVQDRGDVLDQGLADPREGRVGLNALVHYDP